MTFRGSARCDRPLQTTIYAGAAGTDGGHHDQPTRCRGVGGRGAPEAHRDQTHTPYHQALCTAFPRFWPFRGPAPLLPTKQAHQTVAHQTANAQVDRSPDPGSIQQPCCLTRRATLVTVNAFGVRLCVFFEVTFL